MMVARWIGVLSTTVLVVGLGYEEYWKGTQEKCIKDTLNSR